MKVAISLTNVFNLIVVKRKARYLIKTQTTC